MKRSTRNQMLKEHFNHWEEINYRRNRDETLLKLKIYRFVGGDYVDKYGHYVMYYGYNKWNPVVWVLAFSGIFLSFFYGGIVQYIKDFPEEWNMRHYLVVKREIYQKYSEMAQ